MKHNAERNAIRIMPTTRSIRRRRHRRRRRGASVVELALVLPLLVTIVLGCVDFGRFAYYYIAVTNGARVGAGFASFNPVSAATLPVWQQKLRQAVLDEMSPPSFDPNQITIPLAQVVADGDFKRAQVTVSYPFTTRVNWPLLPNNVSLTQTVEMRVIR